MRKNMLKELDSEQKYQQGIRQEILLGKKEAFQRTSGYQW
jgi:hypothetical protein